MSDVPLEGRLPVLQGLTVVVTRARAQSGKLARRLEAYGATIFEFPTIEIRPVPEVEIPPIHAFDWAVFTSSNGVECLLNAMGAAQRGPEEFEHVHVCAVGPGTAQTLDDYGVAVHLMPETSIGDAIVDALLGHDHLLTEKRVFLPRGNLAREDLPNRLRELGAAVTERVVYETAAPPPDEHAVARMMAARPSVVTFTSASTARNFSERVGVQRLETLKSFTAFASIGPQTTKGAEEAGIPIAIEASHHDIDGLVDAIVAWSLDSATQNATRNGEES